MPDNFENDARALAVQARKCARVFAVLGGNSRLWKCDGFDAAWADVAREAFTAHGIAHVDGVAGSRLSTSGTSATHRVTGTRLRTVSVT